jgi:hypothetical protein
MSHRVGFAILPEDQILILLKNLRSSLDSLRTKRGAVKIVGDFPFMLSIVEAFLGFFSRIF